MCSLIFAGMDCDVYSSVCVLRYSAVSFAMSASRIVDIGSIWSVFRMIADVGSYI